MYDKQSNGSLSLLQSKESIAVIALLLIAVAGVGVYAIGTDTMSPTATEEEGPQLEGFDVLATIGDASIDTSSGDVSAVGVDLSSATLDTLDQAGDETVNYEMTVAQTGTNLTTDLSGYGDASVTVNGSQAASQAGSESYGTGVQNDLNISLSDTEAGTLAQDVDVNSGQSIEFNFDTSSSANITAVDGSELDSVTNSAQTATLTVSDISASIDTFSITGSLSAEE